MVSTFIFCCVKVWLVSKHAKAWPYYLEKWIIYDLWLNHNVSFLCVGHIMKTITLLFIKVKNLYSMYDQHSVLRIYIVTISNLFWTQSNAVPINALSISYLTRIEVRNCRQTLFTIFKLEISPNRKQSILAQKSQQVIFAMIL